jgi:hypothetical protein
MPKEYMPEYKYILKIKSRRDFMQPSPATYFKKIHVPSGIYCINSGRLWILSNRLN